MRNDHAVVLWLEFVGIAGEGVQAVRQLNLFRSIG